MCLRGSSGVAEDASGGHVFRVDTFIFGVSALSFGSVQELVFQAKDTSRPERSLRALEACVKL